MWSYWCFRSWCCLTLIISIRGYFYWTSQSPSIVLDKNKIRRERSKSRHTAREQGLLSQITSIYFDGKRDITLCDQKSGIKTYRKKITEEHISVISEPDSQYVGHFTPRSGSVQSISQGILDLGWSQSLNYDSGVAIGSDGTNVNTGWKGGIIKLLEESLEKPLHWFVCLLHSNELPLRHLFASLDGKTSGPRCFTGFIGKGLQDCETKPILYPSIQSQQFFKKLTSVVWALIKCTSMEFTKLSRLVRFHLAYHAVPPGGLNHARWITTANGILRL